MVESELACKEEIIVKFCKGTKHNKGRKMRFVRMTEMDGFSKKSINYKIEQGLNEKTEAIEGIGKAVMG